MTKQVEAIHLAFADKKQSIRVDAGAGCGKTTLIVNGEKLLPQKTLFLAFNKAIATELGERMPRRSQQSMTFHALAFRNLRQRLGKIETNAYKYQALASERFGYSRDEQNLVASIISDFQLNDDPIYLDESEWTADYCLSFMSDQFKFELDCPPDKLVDFVEDAMALLRDEAAKLKKVTFDDMLFFLAYYARKRRWFLRDYDCVVVDEAQDVSPIRKYILTLLSKRLIQVGDTRQAIYAFAGAMTNAMDDLDDVFNCKSYPLSITWRCSTSVIEEASHIVGPFLQARPDANEGSVTDIMYTQFLNSSLDQSCMVVCRMNSPLIKLALALLKRRTPFNFMSDFPERLIKRVQKLAVGTSGMASFKTALNTYYDGKLKDAGDNKSLAKRIEDERETLLYVASESRCVEDVVTSLQELARSSTGVVLATGHKAKGLEAVNVFILRPDLTPAPWVDQETNPEQYQQELNLKYVMITRAKHNLVYVLEENQ